MNRIVLVIGTFIIGVLLYSKISTNLKDNNVLELSSISEIEQKSIDYLKVYDSVYDFPLDEMVFSDHDVFTLLKSSYNEIDFYGDFEPGNLELYDFYKRNFERLINNEVPFIRKETGESIYLKDFKELYLNDTGIFNPDNYKYYFFDMNENGTPELCIADIVSCTYIYEYNSENDSFVLIHELYPSHYQLNGSNKIRWDGIGGTGFYGLFNKYNKFNEEEYSVSFCLAPNFNEALDKSEVVYMAGLPQYVNRSEQIDIPDNIKRQSYYDNAHGIYYFRITEEQYFDLTNDYDEASMSAKRKLKDITYTYDELFTK